MKRHLSFASLQFLEMVSIFDLEHEVPKMPKVKESAFGAANFM